MKGLCRYPFSNCELLRLCSSVLWLPYIPKHRLPFDVSITPLPQLPTEIWEYIIDWIGRTQNIEDYGCTYTFHSCTLVCRSWRDRSRLQLYKHPRIRDSRVLQFQSTLRSNRGLSLSLADAMFLARTPISALFTMSKFVNLKHLRVWALDLTKEHWAITRGPLARSVTNLELLYAYPCTVSTFLRFLNSFNSLIRLRVELNINEGLTNNGQILPPPRPTPNRSLKHLNLDLVSGVAKLIDWYIREGCFLTRLKKLILRWHPNPDPAKGFLYSDGHMALLNDCTDTLEDLTFWICFKEPPSPNELSTLGTFWRVSP